jgi:signal transduction histidine kinase
MSTNPAAGQQSGKPWRLRTRLAIGLAILFVAIFGMIAYSHLQYLNDRRDARIESMERVSETIAASLDGLTHDLESFSLSTAITLGEVRLQINDSVTPEARQNVNNYLQHLFESHGLLRSMFITDTNGIVVFDNDGDSNGLDLSDRTYIQALQSGATQYWSDGFPGSESGKMVFTHSRAIVDPDGEAIGYLVMPLLAEALASRLPAGLAAAGHISIIDGNGTLVLNVPEGDPALIGSDLNSWPALPEVQAPGIFTVEDEPMPLGTGDRYGSFVAMQNLGWTLGYSLPASAISGATTDQFYRDVALLGAIVLAAFVAMWMFASRTVRPLSQLTEMARGISRGESISTATFVESQNAEVLELADTMAHMRRAIRDREDQLRNQNNAIEAIERFGESLASELNLDRAIQAIVDAGVELVEADAVQFCLQERGETGMMVVGPHPTIVLPEDDRLIADVLSGTLIDIADLHAAAGPSPHDYGARPGARSVLGIPIRGRKGDVEGALLLLRSDANAYTGYHRRLATGLGRWASIVLENARLYSQSQELVAELAKANEAKSDFLGIVSHELRTPITTIYGGTLLLRLRRASLPEQAFDDMMVSISEEAERLHHLVADLLAIARTELVIERRPVDLMGIVRNAVGEFATTRKRVVEMSFDPALPEAIGDSTYLRQVINNLITNADKYTPADLPIEVSAVPENGEIVVRVTDHGPGIEEDELPRIFESFYRGKDAGERASGSGLGLTVCRRLVESLGGRIWAQNRPEGGLEVGFTLAVMDDSEQVGAPDGRGRSPKAAAPLADEIVS